MPNLKDLTTAQLEQIISIKQQIEDFQHQLELIGIRPGRGPGRAKGKRRISAFARKIIAKAAKARQAAYRAEKARKPYKPRKRGKMSAATKAKMAAAAIERWKKVREAGKTTL